MTAATRVMPTRGECCGCREAPVQRYRFNVVIEHADRSAASDAASVLAVFLPLVGKLVNQQVERTPQRELDDLSAGVPLADGSDSGSGDAG